jgi:hypothetical protein
MADLVDTVDAIRVFVDGLFNLPNNPPSLYIDIEGVNLLRHSSISILQLLVLSRRERPFFSIYIRLRTKPSLLPGLVAKRREISSNLAASLKSSSTSRLRRPH